MRKLNKELENRKIDYDKLKAYGFIKNNDIYIYDKNIYDDSFKIIIKINNNYVTSKLIDINTNEEYLLVDVVSTSGQYIGKVKEEYEKIINDFVLKCSFPDVFKSKQAKQVIKYIKDKYNGELEYLWKKFPKNAIWRNNKNNTWYGALLVISESKLGIQSDKMIDILDLRSNEVDKLVDNNKIYPGYHMNKDKWITIKLDQTLDIKEIYKLIDKSYDISLKK